MASSFSVSYKAGLFNFRSVRTAPFAFRRFVLSTVSLVCFRAMNARGILEIGQCWSVCRDDQEVARLSRAEGPLGRSIFEDWKTLRLVQKQYFLKND